MYFGKYVFEMRLFNCRTLKDKRAVRQSMVTKMRNRFNVSVSEVSNQDACNVLVIGAATVSSDLGIVENTYDELVRYIDSNYEVDLYDSQIEVL